tara:strand:- start:746 stop:1993 length:1248 start_codon:yes stop_codon:yes gene_type:complete
MKIINEKNRIVPNSTEIVEQELVKKYVKPTDKVLELGARYGAVSVTTNKIITDKKTHYVVEPDAKVWDALETNMKENNCDFNIIKGVIGEKKYKVCGSNYSTYTQEDESSTLKSHKIPNVDFNTLIVDCEGYLETFYFENVEFFKTLDKIILEADEIERCDYEKVFTEFRKLGFDEIEKIKEPTCSNMYHYVFMKPKILFCSLSNRPILSGPMFKNLKSYCDRHNYKCILENDILDTTRAPSWSKIKLLQREMKANPNIDILVWVDDDILLTRHDVQFEDLIAPYPFQNVLVSADVVWSPFNCGVLVIKNDESTYKFLQKIYDMCDEEEYNYFKYNGLWEQDIMVRYCRNIKLMNPNVDSPVTVIPHNIIQSFYRDHDLPEKNKWKVGHFSAHFTGMSLEKRIQHRDYVLNYFKK